MLNRDGLFQILREIYMLETDILIFIEILYIKYMLSFKFIQSSNFLTILTSVFSVMIESVWFFIHHFIQSPFNTIMIDCVHVGYYVPFIL